MALNAPVAPVTQNGQAISRYAGPGAGIGRLAKPIAVDPRISQAKALMYWAMGRKFPLGELAGMLGLSSSRLSHLFRSEVGMSPERYLKAARLARAKALLETSGLSVKQAAAHAGFSHMGRFASDFHKAYGLTPSKYRRAEAQRAIGNQPPRAATPVYLARFGYE